MFDLAGRTVIVTGGAVGIGKVYSRALAEVGANVVIADITDNEGGALTAEINDFTTLSNGGLFHLNA